ncbi:zinc-ribbon domain-containing protein [Arthrobacter sp. ISL-48]|uniref:zinc-ribbon domain-containing protein n=1 Tax=Arthrobacter sp. ISL-48 TaxID=2819110 RepID=UPI001BE809EA|nr:zinc-ribbon domain-containing protein [Arthrobacter sp. ISL-48]MBT2534292.1 zinc-ribbon domain-containing protein [Arthrobacter sp. ISL-48]
MLLIFGLKTVLRALPGRLATCQYCRQYVQHYLKERARKLTLFFIPIFTTSRAYQITCSNCGRVSTISSRQKKALIR